MRTVLLVTLAVLAQPADAACRIKTAKCVEVPTEDYAAPLAVGDRLPEGSFEVLLNVAYHGLPPSDGSFCTSARTGTSTRSSLARSKSSTT